MVDDPPVTEELSLVAAAQRLDVSTRTVRRWIKSGRLEAERLPRDQGGYKWRVTGEALEAARTNVTQGQPIGQPSGQPRGQPDDQEATPGQVDGPAGVIDPRDVMALVREQQDTILQLSGQVGFLQSENEHLKEEVKLLQPPPESEPDEAESVEESEKASETTDTKRRRWWLLWLR